MKYKSDLIMVICCIGLFIGSIYEIYNKNKKLQNKEISVLQFTFLSFFLIYLTIWCGFAAYSYYTGSHEKLVSVAFMPFWIVGLYMYVSAPYKKHHQSV
jgi:hypothetical protein